MVHSRGQETNQTKKTGVYKLPTQQKSRSFNHREDERNKGGGL